MGDIIETHTVRPLQGTGRAFPLRLYFDNGSVRSFLKSSLTAKLGPATRLRHPVPFSGLGNGRFASSDVIHFEIRLLGVWCVHSAFVVPDEVLSPKEDGLIGHDFMQIYDVRLDPKRRKTILNRVALETAYLVR